MRSADVSFADLMRLRSELAARDFAKENTMSFTPKGLMDAITEAADEETKRLTEREQIMSDTGASPSSPSYPDCIVELLDHDGNAFAIMGAVKKALKGHLKERGIQSEIINAATNLYLEEAMAGDYDHLLRTTMSWVTVE